MTEKPTAFHDRHPEDFPFTVEFLNQHGQVVHTIICEGPGVMDIPPLQETYGPVDVRITYPNGHVETGQHRG